jgi:hypothetical protein
MLSHVNTNGTMQVLWQRKGDNFQNMTIVEAKTFPDLGNIQLQFQIFWKANSSVGND